MAKLILDKLKQLITCPVCKDVFSECFALHPCGHTLCGGCLSDTMRTDGALCPVCIVHLSGASYHVQMNRIVVLYERVRPRTKPPKRNPIPHPGFSHCTCPDIEDSDDSSEEEEMETDKMICRVDEKAIRMHAETK